MSSGPGWATLKYRLYLTTASDLNNFNCCCYKLYELATYDDDFCPIYLSQLGLSFVNLEIFKNPDRDGVSKKFSKIDPDRDGVFYTNV